MRQSTKFLFVLVFALSSLFGAMYIGGCSDETNVTETPAESKVIGSIEGIVTNATNNNPVSGVTVTVVLPQAAASNPKGEGEAQAAEEVVTTTTDANGYYLIDDNLGSGEYTVIFTMAGFFSSRQTAYIPTLDEIIEDDESPKGDVPYRDTQDEILWPTAAAVTVSGQLVAPAPSPEFKDNPNVLAAGAAIANVMVTLDYETSDYYYDKDAQVGSCGFSFFPNVFTTTTDANGNFTFTGVPATGCVVLRIAPYKVGPIQYAAYNQLFDLWSLNSSGAVDLGSFIGSITGDSPQITSYNFGEANWPIAVGANLVVTFSIPMNTASVTVDLEWGSTDEPFVLSWDATRTVLTINPNLAFRPANPTTTGYNYDIRINGQAENGLSLGTWTAEFRTADGIAFVATNLDNFGPVGDEFSDFPLDQNITLDFSIAPNLNNPNTYFDLQYDKKKAADPLVDSITVSGNTVTIWPNGILESNTWYCVDFVAYSTLRDDYATDNELTASSLCFVTENTDVTPGNVANFELDEDNSDYPADFNSDSFLFLWDRVPGARWYDLYARDNSATLAGKDKLSERGALAAGNPEYVLIGTVNDQDYLTRQTIFIEGDDLGDAGFDLYEDDGFYTPFSGGLEITFAVKARNGAGSSVGFSNALTIADEVAPAFYVTMDGDADNSAGAILQPLPGDADTTFTLNIDPNSGILEYMQYASNPDFTVQEAGGDDNYRISESQITWEWDNDVRDGHGTVIVPVGEVGSGDRLIVQLTDNSGNTGIDTMFFGPTIQFVSPTATDTTWEAPGQYIGFDVDFTDVYNATGYNDNDEVIIYISLDGGATWFDTLTGYDFDDGDDLDEIWYDLHDTLMVDGNAKIGVQRFDTDLDTAFGAIWGSDLFTINGIMVTSPDSAWVANNPEVYDAGGTDSTAIDIQWTSVGINEVVIGYSGIVKAPFIVTDTVQASAGQFMWYAPDQGSDYTVTIWVADVDDDSRPIGMAPMTVDIIHDEITVIHPSAFEVAPQDADFTLGFNVEWYNLLGSADTLPSLLTIDYGYSDGYDWSSGDEFDSVMTTDVTWTNIFADTDNDGIELWAPGDIPKTMPSDSVFMRFWSLDDAGNPVIHAYSDMFVIAGMKMVDPNGAEEIEAGSDYTVWWRNYGNFADDFTLQYSLNGGTTWTTAKDGATNLTAQTNGGNDFENVNWTVPQNTAQAGVLMRIMSSVDNTIVDQTDSAFSITGFNITFPATTGHQYFVGTLDSVKWAAVGSFDSIDVEFWVDDTVDGSLIMTPLLQYNPNTSQTHVFAPQSNWAIAPIPAAGFNAWIIVRSSSVGGTAQDSISVKLTLANINLTDPDGAEVWQRNTTHDITWTTLGFGAQDSVRIELSADGGGTYPTTIATVPYNTSPYSWLIPAGTTPGTTFRVRLTRLVANVGDGVTDESAADFEITL